MNGSVLVAYATRYGSTREVAEAVAGSLKEDGFAVVLLPLRKVRSLEGVSAVVMGAPLQMFHWYPDALNFLDRFKTQLVNLPVAVFALGPFHREETEFDEARKQLTNDLVKSSWFSPFAVAIFGGKYDPAVLTFPMNLMPALKQIPPIDIRDWDAIRAWAKEVEEKLQTGA